MGNTIVETMGTLGDDGTLQLDENTGIPPGRVKVRLQSLETPTSPKESMVDFVDRIRRELAASGHRFRTKEQIDTELDELRSEWDRRE